MNHGFLGKATVLLVWREEPVTAPDLFAWHVHHVQETDNVIRENVHTWPDKLNESSVCIGLDNHFCPYITRPGSEGQESAHSAATY
jgi:hypothetical protein